MEQLAGYTIGNTIFQGSRSLVYSGVREKDNLPVVIKIPASPFPDEAVIRQVHQEYEIGALLDHPNIVQYLGLEMWGHTPAIIMENFGGSSLPVRSKMDLAPFLDMAIQIAEGLSVIHRHRIMHKDLNPQNLVRHSGTGMIKIIDFGLASRLDHESQDAVNPNRLTGTLPYISPEQTGRMNRLIDYRTDFYSLGVAFYELLCGRLPFEITDPLELVHAHIARIPPWPMEVNPEIPTTVSEIVKKLMAKNAESRYQSALGLKDDLERCREELRLKGEISQFLLGTKDVSESLRVPQTLYGRERELKIMLQTYASAARGESEVIMVTGYSGIGKSSLIKEIHKPVTAGRSFFVSGKFDQFQRDIPYAAITGAFRNLCRQVLAESQERLSQWRTDLQDALGIWGDLLINLIPELESILGKQPSTAFLKPVDAKNRLYSVFQKFISVFTSDNRPLVLFLDDLQWADIGSLDLIHALCTAPKGHFLFMGAFRDQAVDGSHPLKHTMDRLRQDGVRLHSLQLGPLARAHVEQLLAEMLNADAAQVGDLASLVLDKTAGNPFFVNAFLRNLYKAGFLRYDRDVRKWVWDIEEIRNQDITDNVVDLMLNKLRELPENTQQLLHLGACIGHEFEPGILAILSEKDLVEVSKGLWPAIRDGLLIPHGAMSRWFRQGSSTQYSTGSSEHSSVKFLHDRVQQAAYCLGDEDTRQRQHLHIGQHLLEGLSKAELEDKLFAVTGQLNEGRTLIAHQDERIELARLNLKAGLSAQKAAAFNPAAAYLRIGIELLPQDTWETLYSLTYDLYWACAECEYALSHLDEAQELLHALQSHAKTDLERAQILHSLLTQDEWHKVWENVKDDGIEVLRLCEVDFPEEKDYEEVKDSELKQVEFALKKGVPRPGQKALTDEKMICAIKVLAFLCIKGYISGQITVSILCLAKALNLILRNGYIEELVFFLTRYGNLKIIQEKYKEGYEFGKLALELLEHHPESASASNSFSDIASVLIIYGEPMQNAVQLHMRGNRAAREWGQHIGAITCRTNAVYYYFAMGEPLNKIRALIVDIKKHCEKARFAAANDVCIGYQQIIQVLEGQDDDLLFTEEFVGKEAWERIHSTGIASQIHHLRMQRQFWLGNYKKAMEIAREVMPMVEKIPGYIHVPENRFFLALTLARVMGANPNEDDLNEFNLQLTKLRELGGVCPENFRFKYDLVRAERARSLKAPMLEVCNLFREAAQGARENGFIQYQALANQLFGEFWLGQDMDNVARTYLLEARYLYQRWGALGMVAAIEHDHAALFLKHAAWAGSLTPEEAVHVGITHTTNNDGTSLDLAAVMKANRAISSEIQLDRLVGLIMKIMLESSGARRGFLILKSDGKLQAVATADMQGVEVLSNTPLDKCGDLAEKVIQYVLHTGKSLMVPDPAEEGFSIMDDPYLEKNPQLAILCTPILYQERILGLLYLENEISLDVFNEGRIRVLKILLGQAAISLENARLYKDTFQLNQDLRREVIERERVEQEIRELNEALEARVRQRTAQLESAQKELVEKAHLAGMADIATSVLHNLGNVLNSVNISTQVIAQQISTTKVGGLVKANRKLQEIEACVDKDKVPLVEKLGEYYKLVTDLLHEDFQVVGENIERISTNVDLIREVIMAQQRYVTTDANSESLPFAGVVQEALAILEGTISRDAIQIVKDFKCRPFVDCKKVKLVHVIISLIRNSVEAMNHSEVKQITLFMDANEKCGILTVTDTGSGIASQHLPKIFGHGFTTKPGSHGFGLHTCANALTEMHGHIEAKSEGCDQGASMTIYLPLGEEIE